jgi:transcription elongation factor
MQSPRAMTLDAQQNTIKIGDTVTVTAGAHAKLIGTIKHTIKGSLWLHSNTYLKNSGIFVVRGFKINNESYYFDNHRNSQKLRRRWRKEFNSRTFE